MILTEEEARTKLCWRTLTADGGGLSAYSPHRTSTLMATRCVASDCMAWQWADDVVERCWRGQASIYEDRAPSPEEIGKLTADGWTYTGRSISGYGFEFTRPHPARLGCCGPTERKFAAEPRP